MAVAGGRRAGVRANERKPGAKNQKAAAAEYDGGAA